MKGLVEMSSLRRLIILNLKLRIINALIINSNCLVSGFLRLAI
jgi:hypothetical protein